MVSQRKKRQGKAQRDIQKESGMPLPLSLLTSHPQGRLSAHGEGETEELLEVSCFLAAILGCLQNPEGQNYWVVLQFENRVTGSPVSMSGQFPIELADPRDQVATPEESL